jgi:hypothetical protein
MVAMAPTLASSTGCRGRVSRPPICFARKKECLTNRRNRRLPQARLVQGTIRAFVGAADLNVRQGCP